LISAQSAWFIVLGYCVILTFFILQRRLRRTEGAKSLKGGAYERGNTFLISAATGLGLLLPPSLTLLGVGTFQPSLAEGLAAIVVMVTGLWLRLWAAATLGVYYTSTLTMTEGQSVVTSGPYGRVRHPGYLGSILLWAGFAVLSSDIILVVLIPIMFVAAYLYRIASEERMLLSKLGSDYEEYRRRTRRLIPYIY